MWINGTRNVHSQKFSFKIGLKLHNLQMIPDAHLLHEELPE